MTDEHLLEGPRSPFVAAKLWMQTSLILAGIGLATAFGLTRLRPTESDDGVLRHAPKERPALLPAGRLRRVPASHPTIIPHFVPGLSALAPDPIDLLLPAP
ncbi:MAG: hypothetical protein AAFR44_10440 [Pseudomonadota bacterium]